MQNNSAELSNCRQYRFALWRTWDDTKPQVMFIGLNPSTADESCDDPTLIRCINFAKSWGYGGVCMANLFAYRATAPADMKAATDPIGPDNNRWLLQLADQADKVIAAWGNDGSFMDRAKVVTDILPQLYCLKINQTGEPAHPLYQKANVKPLPMNF